MALLVGVLAACAREPTPSDAAYVPLQTIPTSNSSAAGSLKADFDVAMRAPTRAAAIQHWRAFLRQHAPQNGEYEDAFQANHVRAAQIELMRLLYLTGDVVGGDELLRKLETVDMSTGKR